jgi:hypothetical protein
MSPMNQVLINHSELPATRRTENAFSSRNDIIYFSLVPSKTTQDRAWGAGPSEAVYTRR